MIDTTGRLLLLASFSIDYTLPKYTRADLKAMLDEHALKEAQAYTADGKEPA
jgi:hypothetical protein